MTWIIGRALYPHEEVHHKNGIRDDNSPENIELWSTSQPSGQRVEDKLVWAREFIRQYEEFTVSEQEKPAPEIRGGNRPTDYITEWPVAHEDPELEDGAESYQDGDPDWDDHDKANR